MLIITIIVMLDNNFYPMVEKELLVIVLISEMCEYRGFAVGVVVASCIAWHYLGVQFAHMDSWTMVTSLLCWGAVTEPPGTKLRILQASKHYQQPE